MPTLAELQAELGRALLAGDAGGAAQWIASDGIGPEARLDIYRHHVVTTLTGVLEAAFPVVVRLVDRRFFAYAADAYIRARPPADPRLTEYGATFADFLTGFEPCRHLAYLPDVARLEWAMHAAAHAPDAEPIDAGALAGVPVAELPNARLEVHPSLTYVASPWPLDRIWRASQDDSDDARIDLDAGGAHLEVRRDEDGDVAMRSLDPAPHALRAALAGGATLADAAAAALAIDPSLDLAGAIADLVSSRILVGVSVSK
jgi:hypothetical protein